MCVDPLTLIGIGVSAVGSIVAGQQQAQMADYQARAYEQQAKAEGQAAAYEANKERRQQALAASRAIAATGASGVALAGSPTEVLSANAKQGQMDIQAILYGSNLRQNNLQTQAGISRFQGRQAQTAGIIGGLSNFTSGISRAVQMNNNPFR